MILAVDIGNSDIVFGLYEHDKWQRIWRIPSDLTADSTIFSTFLKRQFENANLTTEKINHIALSSVVPVLTPVLKSTLVRLFHKDVLVIGPKVYPYLELGIRRPKEIGTDLVANAFAAYRHFRQACIVVDFGTALTLTTIAKDGQILGVAIAPGIKTAMKALAANAAQLPEIPLTLPVSVIGKNTVHAIQAGILWGYVGLVEGLIRQTQAEVGEDCKVVATGGLSFILSPLQSTFDSLNPQLTLDGIRLIGEVIWRVAPKL